MTNAVAVASASAWYSDPDFVAARQRTVPAGGVGAYGMFAVCCLCLCPMIHFWFGAVVVGSRRKGQERKGKEREGKGSRRKGREEGRKRGNHRG